MGTIQAFCVTCAKAVDLVEDEDGLFCPVCSSPVLEKPQSMRQDVTEVPAPEIFLG